MTRRVIWSILVMTAIGAALAVKLVATPASGFSGTTIAAARFGEIDLKAHTIPANEWQARLKTQGLSDIYVQSNVWQAGGSTGWHTHPGPSLIMVTSGTITTYDGDDPTCTPHVYSAATPGQNSFVDIGGGDVHLVRNETTGAATAIAVQMIPAGATRRVDAPNPGHCSF